MRRPWLVPLVPLYWLGARVAGLLRGRPLRLAGGVVSVGSLSAGGAGKTPVVMMVVEMLRSAGYAVDVLSRGFGRSGEGVERVEVDGTAARFGDEPMLMARRLGVPVWVGRDRYAAGQEAEASDGGEVVHVLDDGFQHRRLRRDVDVVLLTAEDARDEMLPAGNLREGQRALRRAHVVVLREEEADDLRGLIPEGKTVWVVRRKLQVDATMQGKVLAFCGIARPQGFLGMLVGVGVIVAETVCFRDHHVYGMRDVTRLIALARGCGAEGFVTTEKDGVKLTAAMRRRLEEVGPVCLAELRLELIEGRVEDLLGRLR